MVWLAVKIGVFYGAPALALVIAIAYFAVLLVRVRRGTITRRIAAARYLVTLLLPPAVVIVVWCTAELAGYFAVESGGFVWDSTAAVQLFVTLLPILAYVGIPIVGLVILFWLTLAYWQGSRPQ